MPSAASLTGFVHSPVAIDMLTRNIRCKLWKDRCVFRTLTDFIRITGMMWLSRFVACMRGRRLSTSVLMAVLPAGSIWQVRPAIHHAAVSCSAPGVLRSVVPALRSMQRLGTGILLRVH